jgi:hypothetical protein
MAFWPLCCRRRTRNRRIPLSYRTIYGNPTEYYQNEATENYILRNFIVVLFAKYYIIRVITP